MQTIVDAAMAGEEVRVTGLGIFTSSPERLGRDVILRPANPSTSPPVKRCDSARERRPKTN